MICAVRGIQGSGKTLSMVLAALYLLTQSPVRHLYTSRDVVGNVSLNQDIFPGAQSLNVEGIRAWLRSMIDQGYRRRIILLDEIDRIFPARFWSDRKQTEGLLGLWQDEKCENFMVWTAHVGVGVDKIIRDTTMLEFIPELDKRRDRVELTVLNQLTLSVGYWRIDNVSVAFRYYNRWQLIK